MLLFAFSKDFNFIARNSSTFSKNPNFERFQKSYYLSRNLWQVCYKLIRKMLKHWINQRWLVYKSSLGKHEVKKQNDSRRRFCFPCLKFGGKWNQWEMSFLQVFVVKTSIGPFSPNEQERNLNKRRRQLQSPVLGVLVFLWRKFLDFWLFLPSSWQLIFANFARYCTSFQDRGKKCKKSVGVLSRQAKRSKIFAKEARESCIKVIHDHSSFSCNLHQICYLQPFLMNQFFFRKNPYFFTILFKFFQVLKNLTNSIAFYSKFVILSRFWWINFFPENPSFFQILLKFFELLKNLTNSIAFCNKFAMFCHFWKSSKFSENLFVFVKQLKFFEGFEKTGNFSCILLQNFQL